MVHHEFTTFSQKDYISHFGNAWGNFGLQARRSSSTVAIFWLVTAPTSGLEKRCSKWCFKLCFFLAILNRKTTIYASFFAPEKTCFLHFLMQHPQHMFCYFFVHQIVLLFCLSSCPISCFFLRFCAPNRALNCAIVTGHEKDTICTYVCAYFNLFHL